MPSLSTSQNGSFCALFQQYTNRVANCKQKVGNCKNKPGGKLNVSNYNVSVTGASTCKSERHAAQKSAFSSLLWQAPVF
jgi:hypothetical protein